MQLVTSKVQSGYLTIGVAASISVIALFAISAYGSTLPDVFDRSPRTLVYWALYGLQILATLVAAVEIGRAVGGSFGSVPQGVLTGIFCWGAWCAFLATAVSSAIDGPVFGIVLLVLLGTGLFAASLSVVFFVRWLKTSNAHRSGRISDTFATGSRAREVVIAVLAGMAALASLGLLVSLVLELGNRGTYADATGTGEYTTPAEVAVLVSSVLGVFVFATLFVVFLILAILRRRKHER